MKKITIISFSITLMIFSFVSLGQGPVDPPCDNEDPSLCPDVPFDGGASLLLAGGASLLGWTAWKRKKKND